MMSDADSNFDDLFYVLLPDDQSVTLSLDELDEAFNADQISDQTLVCRVGDTRWVTLAELASLADEPPAPSPPSAPVYVAPMKPPAAYVPPAPASRAPDSMAPVAADLSLAALDDDFDPDMLALRPKRRAVWVVSAMAAMAVAGVATLVVAGGTALSAPQSAQAAAMMTLPATAKETPKPLEAAAPAPPAPVASATPVTPPAQAPSAAPPGDRFSDDMKRALLEADDKRTEKKGAVAAKKGGKLRKARPARAKAKRGKGKGKGNAYDPLNGNL
jgi:hypothetical protein